MGLCIRSKGQVLVGIVIKFTFDAVKPMIANYIKEKAKAYFINKGLEVFSSDSKEVESININVTGGGENYTISSECEDHDGDRDLDNNLERDFDEDDTEDMQKDINYLCSAQLNYFDDYYQEEN